MSHSFQDGMSGRRAHPAQEEKESPHPKKGYFSGVIFFAGTGARAVPRSLARASIFSSTRASASSSFASRVASSSIAAAWRTFTNRLLGIITSSGWDLVPSRAGIAAAGGNLEHHPVEPVACAKAEAVPPGAGLERELC